MGRKMLAIERGTEKFCPSCGEWRSVTEFFAHPRGGLRSRCKPCLGDRQRAYRLRVQGPYVAPSLIVRLERRTRFEVGGCWSWLGTTNVFGYGAIQAGRITKGGNRRQSLVHRVAYEITVGPIPEGMTLDHLCFNKVCWNPKHLEPVPSAENSRRARLREIAIYGMPKAGNGRPLTKEISA